MGRRRPRREHPDPRRRNRVRARGRPRLIQNGPGFSASPSDAPAMGAAVRRHNASACCSVESEREEPAAGHARSGRPGGAQVETAAPRRTSGLPLGRSRRRSQSSWRTRDTAESKGFGCGFTPGLDPGYFGGHPTRLPTAGEHIRGTRVSQTRGRAVGFGLRTAWARQDSNLDLTDYESAALTIELRARGPKATGVCGFGGRQGCGRSVVRHDERVRACRCSPSIAISGVRRRRC